MIQFLTKLTGGLRASRELFVQHADELLDEHRAALSCAIDEMTVYLKELRDAGDAADTTGIAALSVGYVPLDAQKNYADSILSVASDTPHKQLNLIDAVAIPPIRLRVVADLHDIQPMFCWFAGNRTYKKGVYVCVAEGFYLRITLPRILRGDSKTSRFNTVRCKHITLDNCRSIRNTHKQCTYVHMGERFSKSSSTNHRPDGLGCHETLEEDLARLSNYDVKHMMMYSLSDDLLAAIWYQNFFTEGDLVLTNLDLL